MRGRWTVSVLAAIIAALAVALAACGSTAASTTSLAPATTEPTALTTTSAAVSTSVTTSPDGSSTTVSGGSAGIPTAELQVYLDAMGSFAQAFATGPDTSFLNITDPSTATAADSQQADAASAFAHKLQDQLLAIQAPAVVAALHNEFVSFFQAEVKSMDDFIAALKAKDAARMKTAHDALAQQVENIGPVLTQLLSVPGVK